MTWIRIDMRHKDPRRTKLANYDLAIAMARAFRQRKVLRSARRHRDELRRELRDERDRAFPMSARRHGR